MQFYFQRTSFATIQDNQYKNEQVQIEKNGKK